MKYSVKTPAKLNLGLKVGPERPDGYHEIRTVFQTIGIFDRLTVWLNPDSSDEIIVTGCRSNGVPDDEENLVFRTLKRVRESGIDLPGCRIKLRKRIPNRAGLGGGSSDAAALLKILRSYTEAGGSNDGRFERIARQVGADVSFFLVGGTAEATGRGDEFRQLRDVDGWALIVNPPYGVDTKWAYQRLEERNLVRDDRPQGYVSPETVDWATLDLSNDFRTIISRTEPLQDRLLNRLGEFTRACSVSGSGSALYGLFEMKREGQRARKTLGTEFPDVEFELVKFLGRGDIPKLEREVPCQSK